MKHLRVRNLFLAMTIVIVAACSKTDNPIAPDTGAVNTGQSVDVVSTTVSSAGSTITVSKPGSPVDGMTIIVPQNAYSGVRTWSVSYAPITSHKLGSDFNPISPLITIKNGGGYSDSPMVVRVPCTVPAGKFAMAFNYDAATGLLEGLPLVACDSNGVTFQTRHFAFNIVGKHVLSRDADPSFAQIVISMIDDGMLQGDISSTFKPGIDDWEFTNYGSWAAPHGICAGMSASAMYYFDQIKPATHAPLYNLLDIVHTQPMWSDNSLGIRFASMCQADYMMNGEEVQFSTYFLSIASTWKDQYRAFAYAMKLTHQPQFVVIRRNGGGHALVAYNANNNVLSVADPNWPGVLTREIVFNPATARFTPYEGGANAAKPGHLYPEVYYFARTALIGWDNLEKHWKETQAGTVGAGCFPPYTLWVKDGTGYELKDALNTDNDTLPVQLKCPTAPNQDDGALYYVVYDSIGTRITASDAGHTGVIHLDIGTQRLGFWIVSEVHQSCSGNALAVPETSWVDFRWVTVTRTGLEISSRNFDNEPFSKTGTTDSTYTLMASSSVAHPAQTKYVWSFGDGSTDVTKYNDSTVQHRFARGGSSNVSATLYNNTTGTKVAQAKAVALLAGGKPTVTLVAPDSLVSGLPAVIHGYGFGATQGSSTIMFDTDRVAPVVTAWSDTLIRVLAPDCIASGFVRVTVNGVTSDVKSPARYNVITPHIDLVVPPDGRAGTVVRLIGKGFGASQNSGQVLFGSSTDKLLTPISWSDTLVVVAVPLDCSITGERDHFTIRLCNARMQGQGAFKLLWDWLRIAQSRKSVDLWWKAKDVFTLVGTECTYENFSSVGYNPNVTWADSTFTVSWDVTSDGLRHHGSIHGALSHDGKILRTIAGTYYNDAVDGSQQWDLTMNFTDLPLDTVQSSAYINSTLVFIINGAACAGHASNLTVLAKTTQTDNHLVSYDFTAPDCESYIKVMF